MNRAASAILTAFLRKNATSAKFFGVVDPNNSQIERSLYIFNSTFLLTYDIFFLYIGT